MPAPTIARIPFLLDARLAEVAGAEHMPVAWQGAPFAPPRGPWVRPLCKAGETLDAEKGREGASRRTGLYLVDVLLPGSDATGAADPAEAWRIAAAVEAAFRREDLHGLQTGDPFTDNLGVDAYDALHLRVTVPWWCWNAG